MVKWVSRNVWREGKWGMCYLLSPAVQFIAKSLISNIFPIVHVYVKLSVLSFENLLTKKKSVFSYRKLSYHLQLFKCCIYLQKFILTRVQAFY